MWQWRHLFVTQSSFSFGIMYSFVFIVIRAIVWTFLRVLNIIWYYCINKSVYVSIIYDNRCITVARCRRRLIFGRSAKDDFFFYSKSNFSFPPPKKILYTSNRTPLKTSHNNSQYSIVTLEYVIENPPTQHRRQMGCWFVPHYTLSNITRRIEDGLVAGRRSCATHESIWNLLVRGSWIESYTLLP